MHASRAWSRAHLEETPEQVAPQLLAAFAEAVGQAMPAPALARAHRWRYALPETTVPGDCLFDPGLQVGACGDWCSGPRVEGAFTSGAALAGRLLGLGGGVPVFDPAPVGLGPLFAGR